MNKNFFKCLTIFLVGLILGFLISKIDFAPTVSTITEKGSVKVMGSNNAPISVVEYTDFQCPLCYKYFAETYPTIVDKYVKTGKAKYEFKHFPLQIHPQARAAGLASECALEQNKFWEMHDSLFASQKEWSGNENAVKIFKRLAGELKLNQAKFDECIDTQKFAGNVSKDLDDGLNNNVRGTPTLFINGQPIVGAQDTAVFTSKLDEILSGTTK